MPREQGARQTPLGEGVTAYHWLTSSSRLPITGFTANMEHELDGNQNELKLNYIQLLHNFYDGTKPRSNRRRSIWRASASDSGRGDRRYLREMRTQHGHQVGRFKQFLALGFQINNANITEDTGAALPGLRRKVVKSPHAAMALLVRHLSDLPVHDVGQARSRPSVELRFSCSATPTAIPKGRCGRFCVRAVAARAGQEAAAWETKKRRKMREPRAARLRNVLPRAREEQRDRGKGQEGNEKGND